MFFIKKIKSLLPVIIFVSILLAGFVASVITLKELPAASWKELTAPEKILSGEATHRFIQLLNQHFVLGKTFSQIEHGIIWNLTGDWGARVRPGCEDWLFLSDELELHPGREKSAQRRVAQIAQLQKQLEARGIKLFVVIVPDKTRIERAHLCTLSRPAVFENRIENWQRAIRQERVDVLDLTAALMAETTIDRYYHTDTHWNEAGADVAANAIAAELRALNRVQGAGAPVGLNKTLTDRPGDLIHLAGLDDLPAFLRPAVEQASLTTVEPLAVASDDLFGDTGLPRIALIGTSYSRNSNFVPFLEHRLGEAVANFSKEGGNFFGAAAAYFGSREFRDSPPELLIWEIPERVIEMPVTREESDSWNVTTLPHS